MTAGDTLCTVFGLRVPLILRAKDGEGRFSVVGESYMDGVMDGELFRRTADGRIEPAVDCVQLQSFILI